MRLVIVATREEAEQIAKSVDQAMGYPQTPDTCTAVHVGGGIHVTHPACCTVRNADPIEGKDGWAYPANEKVRTLDSDEVRKILVEQGLSDDSEFARKQVSNPMDMVAAASIK